MAERRRLPVLQNKPSGSAGQSGDAEDDGEARPPWQWVGFGTVAIFAAWLPLAYVAGAVRQRVVNGRFGEGASRDQIELAVAAMSDSERVRLTILLALPGLLALAFAAFGGGIVVGRWGTSAGAREAALAGAVTAVIAGIMAWAGPSLASIVALVVTLAVAVVFAAWGGRVGSRRKKSV